MSMQEKGRKHGTRRTAFTGADVPGRGGPSLVMSTCPYINVASWRGRRTRKTVGSRNRFGQGHSRRRGILEPILWERSCLRSAFGRGVIWRVACVRDLTRRLGKSGQSGGRLRMLRAGCDTPVRGAVAIPGGACHGSVFCPASRGFFRQGCGNPRFSAVFRMDYF